MPSLYAVMSGADDQDRPARERRNAANAAIAAAAVRLTRAMDERIGAPWYDRFGHDGRGPHSRCIGCDRIDRGEYAPHDADCPALALDAAIRATAEATP